MNFKEIQNVCLSVKKNNKSFNIRCKINIAKQVCNDLEDWVHYFRKVIYFSCCFLHYLSLIPEKQTKLFLNKKYIIKNKKIIIIDHIFCYNLKKVFFIWFSVCKEFNFRYFIEEICKSVKLLNNYCGKTSKKMCCEIIMFKVFAIISISGLHCSIFKAGSTVDIKLLSIYYIKNC